MSVVLKLKTRPVEPYPVAPLTISDAVMQEQDSPEEQRRIVAERYENPWWLTNDPYQLAYYQLRQPVLMVAFSRLHEAVKLCLGEHVDVNRFLDPQQLFDEIFNPQRSAR